MILEMPWWCHLVSSLCVNSLRKLTRRPPGTFTGICVTGQRCMMAPQQIPFSWTRGSQWPYIYISMTTGTFGLLEMTWSERKSSQLRLSEWAQCFAAADPFNDGSAAHVKWPTVGCLVIWWRHSEWLLLDSNVVNNSLKLNRRLNVAHNPVKQVCRSEEH